MSPDGLSQWGFRAPVVTMRMARSMRAGSSRLYRCGSPPCDSSQLKEEPTPSITAHTRKTGFLITLNTNVESLEAKRMDILVMSCSQCKMDRRKSIPQVATPDRPGRTDQGAATPCRGYHRASRRSKPSRKGSRPVAKGIPGASSSPAA